MPSRRLLTHFSAPLSVAFGLFIFCESACATTIVSVIGKNGIVMLSDSKGTRPWAPAGEICRGGDIKKIAVIQDRWAVAGSDWACFHEAVRFPDGSGDEVAFDFIPWIHELERGIPKDASFDQFVGTIRDKFSDLVPQIEPFIAHGVWKRGEQQNSGNNFEPLITFSIAGYDSGVPRLTVVKFYIDWDTKTVLGAYLFPIKLRPVESGTNYNYAGISESIADFPDGNSYAHKRAIAIDRKAFTNVFDHGFSTLDESVAVGRVLVQIEEEIRPDLVSGPIRGVRITPDGRATEVIAALPKPEITKKQTPKK